MTRLNLLPLVGDMPMGERSDQEILAALEAEIAGLEAVERAVHDVIKVIDDAAAEVSGKSSAPLPGKSSKSKRDSR